MLNKSYRKLLTTYIISFLIIYNLYAANIADVTKDNKETAKTNYLQDEKRKHIRFNCKSIKYPIRLLSNDKRVNSLIDISKGGISFNHNNSIQNGETLPVEIKYKDIEIKTTVKVLSSDEKRAGGEFILQDNDTLNGLFFLSIALEFDNGLLKTKLSKS